MNREDLFDLLIEKELELDRYYKNGGKSCDIEASEKNYADLLRQISSLSD